ncbi:MAG: sulfotransferase domain-containing protein [Actinobacteria bacterium]|nr:sulfotransferase domain-containing protein [Actinomycetota bacterium]
MTAAQTKQPNKLNDQLDWILDILRGNDDAFVVSTGELPDGHVEIDRFTVYPSIREPRLLVSGGSNRVRHSVLQRSAERSGKLGSIARRVSAQAALIGADQLALGPDVIISRPHSDHALPDGSTPTTLREHLEAAIDGHELCIGVTVGPLRPNRKPVLQLMDHSGQLVAYAKVGWDDSTRAMVDHEVAALDKLPRLQHVAAPKVLHSGHWRGLSVLVTAPVVHDGPADASTSLLLDAARDIAAMTTPATAALRSAEWTKVQRRRIADLGPVATDLAVVFERCIELHGDRRLVFGSSHGDWAPWNMRRVGHRLGVWDWERSRNDAPIGLDIIHYNFQEAFHASGQSVADGIDAVRQAVPALLTELGVAGEDHELIAVLYLVELTLRFGETSIADDTTLANTRADLVVELEYLVPRVGDPTEDRRLDRHPATPGKSRVFTRRMLGGPGVPAPARQLIKSSAKAVGRATASHRVLPNTYIVGGQRCGTTSLFRYLTQNRSVTGPTLEKGVHYYDTNYERGADWYRSHFPTRRAVRLAKRYNGVEQSVVEASPYYLFHPFIPARIHDLTPDARVLVLVRDPVGRALSHHNHEVKRGFENLDFGAAIEAESDRMRGEIDRLASEPGYVSYAHQHHSYVGRGQYAEQIRRYDKLFGQQNVKVVRTQDLEVDPRTTVDSILRFLGIPLMGKVSFPHYNARQYSSMDPGLKQQLTDTFAESDAWVADRLGLDELWR